jgi:membrane protein implicated in regulation of membrane protease activity
MLIYAAMAAFGFLFLIVMLFLGEFSGGDHDAGAGDAHVEPGGIDHGGPGIFSARIMAAFVTAFGVGGVVGRYYNLSHPAASGVGVVSGIVMAGLVYEFAKMLYSQQASVQVRIPGLIGRSAEVSVAIPAGGVGQISLMASGERSEHIARSAGGQAIPRGAEVVVTGLRGDSLVVAPPKIPPPGGTR